MGTFTAQNLLQIIDSAKEYGFGDAQESRFATQPLECQQTGLALHRLKPGKRSPIAHRHANQEELYVVVAGSGTAKFDDQRVEFGQWDAFRLAPDVVRGWEAGPKGADILAFGAPVVDGDEPDRGDLVGDHWDT
jgi:quercetin dioxygenase-like cupin family protein